MLLLLCFHQAASSDSGFHAAEAPPHLLSFLRSDPQGQIHQHVRAASLELSASALGRPSDAIKTVSARCCAVNEHTRCWPSGFGSGQDSLSALFLPSAAGAATHSHRYYSSPPIRDFQLLLGLRVCRRRRATHRREINTNIYEAPRLHVSLALH